MARPRVPLRLANAGPDRRRLWARRKMLPGPPERQPFEEAEKFRGDAGRNPSAIAAIDD
jgi:hypothetical protein